MFVPKLAISNFVPLGLVLQNLQNMSQVLISGGSGLVGKALCEKLQAKGYSVAILSRTN